MLSLISTTADSNFPACRPGVKKKRENRAGAPSLGRESQKLELLTDIRKGRKLPRSRKFVSLSTGMIPSVWHFLWRGRPGF